MKTKTLFNTIFSKGVPMIDKTTPDPVVIREKVRDYTTNLVEENGNDVVTLVRKRTVYDQQVISRKEYEKMNQLLKESTDDPYGGPDWGPEFIERDFGKWETSELANDWSHEVTPEEYIVFPSDVTSFTDDALGFMFENQPWSDGLYVIEEASA